jgi:hypothetical protein
MLSVLDSSALLITDVVIEEGVTHIGTKAFAALPKLESVTIPASVSSIGYYVFNESDGLQSITVAAENTRYSSKDGVLFSKQGDGDTLLFYPKNMPQNAYTIPSNVIAIGKDAFAGNRNLKSVTIPGNVKTIGEEAFVDSDLRFVTIENGVTVIESLAFVGCDSLTSITIPGSVDFIGGGAFMFCINLTSVVIEDGVTTIGETAFESCTNLTSITIPSSVTSIENSAFSRCFNLDSIINLNPIPFNISKETFDSIPPVVCLYVPKKSVNSYRRADLWRAFKCIKPIH